MNRFRVRPRSRASSLPLDPGLQILPRYHIEDPQCLAWLPVHEHAVIEAEAEALVLR